MVKKKKTRKSLIFAVFASLMLLGTVTAYAATYVTNGDIRVFGHANRPLIGNIRGHATVSQVIRNNGLRARAIVINMDASGHRLTPTTGVLFEDALGPGDQHWHNGFFGAIFDSPQVVGTSRHGFVEWTAQNRVNFENNWRPIIRANSQTW